MKYLTNSGLSYFFNKMKTYLTSSTYLNSIGITNSDIDDIADDAGYSSGSLPASEDIFITGDIIPNTDNSVDLGASSKNIKMIYTKGITINGTQFLPSDYAQVSHTHTTSDITDFPTIPTKTSDLTNDSGYITLNYAVPIWGGAVMTGGLGKTTNNTEFSICGGTDISSGSSVNVFGKSYPSYGLAGAVRIITNDGSNDPNMYMFPNGTLTWNGQAIQLVSDQRYKQQISEIDDKLLDAWEDVELVQFKYNDAVNEKGDNARLHTGYVVQQIDETCKSHNVDISEYGLYCHEEYPERTEEVTIENEDGTTSKETKVIEEAKEHYSLRYTETLVVECAYLRRENDKLKQQFKQLEKVVNELKSIINYSEIPNS